MLPLPPDPENTAPATKFASHLHSAASITQIEPLSRTLDDIQSPTKRCPCHANAHPDAENTAISKVLRLSLRLSAARQHPVPSDSYQMLPLPRKHTHTQMQKILRLPRNLCAISKVLRLSRRLSPRAARSTTSSHPPNAAPATQTHTQMQKILRLPRNLCSISKVLRLSLRLSAARQHPVPSDSYQMLPLPRKHTHPDGENTAPATKSVRHLQSAAPVTQIEPPSRALDNIQSL